MTLEELEKKIEKILRQYRDDNVGYFTADATADILKLFPQVPGEVGELRKACEGLMSLLSKITGFADRKPDYYEAERRVSLSIDDLKNVAGVMLASQAALSSPASAGTQEEVQP